MCKRAVLAVARRMPFFCGESLLSIRAAGEDLHSFGSHTMVGLCTLPEAAAHAILVSKPHNRGQLDTFGIAAAACSGLVYITCTALAVHMLYWYSSTGALCTPRMWFERLPSAILWQLCRVVWDPVLVCGIDRVMFYEAPCSWLVITSNLCNKLIGMPALFTWAFVHGILQCSTAESSNPVLHGVVLVHI